MKIAEIVATFPPYHGGMGYVCYHNALGLARRGHDVTVFTLDHGRLDSDDRTDRINTVRLKAVVRYGDGGPVPGLYSRLKGFDIAHLHYPFFGGAEYVYLASRLAGLPYLVTYHMDVYGTTLLKRSIINVYDSILMGKVVRSADLVAALSLEHLKSSKASRFVDWDKVVEIPNGVDSDIFRPREKKKELLDRYDLEEKTIVLFVGNLQRFKGLDILIEAIGKIRDEGTVLLVVGGGYEERRYKEQVRRNRLEKRVIFAGPASQDAELPAYYNLCDYLVLPSTHSESFGLVVLEAMSSGKPVIVSSLPGPSRLIENGVDGLIAKSGDVAELVSKIEFLASSEEKRVEMGAAGRKKVLDKYRWDIISDKLERTLLAILDGKRSVQEQETFGG